MKFRNQKVDVVIDVRSRLEFFFGRVPDAVCVPLGRVSGAELEQRGIARDASILVYCASGRRSAMAAEVLKRDGFTGVIDGGGLAEARRGLTED